MNKSIQVAILQHRLLHYRVKFFNLLRTRLATFGIDLLLVHGQASPTEALRKDEGHLEWAIRVKNYGLRINGRDVIWQPLPEACKSVDLCIMIQENRILSNYWLQIQRPLRRRLLGFWGHGRNYQSRAPDGILESWKAWWLLRVDWWFAYTQSTKEYVIGAGFDPNQATVLDNAIDGTGFDSDLNSWSASEINMGAKAIGLQPSSQVAIYCGSLYADKRINILLESADLIRQRLPNFHLLVIGSGPEAEAVANAAKTRPWLHSLGIQNGRSKAKYFRMAQLMLNPGLVGLHVVDAFVARTPLVTQASAKHSPEYAYLVHKRNGWVVDEDSAAAYADAVEKIFSSPSLLSELREQCARDAKRYTLDNMVENFAQGVVACLRAHGRSIDESMILR